MTFDHLVGKRVCLEPKGNWLPLHGTLIAFDGAWFFVKPTYGQSGPEAVPDVVAKPADDVAAVCMWEDLP